MFFSEYYDKNDKFVDRIILAETCDNVIVKYK